MIFCDQRRAKSSHKSRNVGTNGFYTRYLFKGSEYGFVVERTALNDNVAAKLGSVCQLDNLK